jgi:hypothetical protein
VAPKTLIALTFAVAASACAVNSANGQDIAANDPEKHARGDYDGDGRTDRADFIEDDEGHLVLIVRRAAAPDAALEIWGGDIASYPYFNVSTAPAGTYRTLCHLYDGCSESVPEQVTLTHDGIIVHAVEGRSDHYYYWDGTTFQNIIISE